MNNVNNLLIIGNGFDIAHGYPTSYLDFADIVGTFRSLYVNKIIRNSNGLINIGKAKYDYLDWFIFGSEKYSEEFYTLIKDNKWIELFDQTYKSLNAENFWWYDLEGIIKDAVDNPDNETTMDHDKALSDLQSFKRAFEIYILLFIEYAKERHRRIPTPNSFEKHIGAITPDYIINYNYTDTFSRIYDEKVQVDYIHGQAKLNSNIKNCQIVFGINDISYIPRINSYAEFTKNYQCKENHLISHYQNWMKSKAVNVHIYGHSLSITDKESLQDILSCDGVEQISLWSFNEADFIKKKSAVMKILEGSRKKDPHIEYKRI